jgi:acetyltransferase-like isoleucine patch superfamily enzyme
MKIKGLKVDSLLGLARAWVFYLINRSKYYKLELGALILKPLRLDGRKYMSVHKKVVVQKYSWLIALKIDDHDPELIIDEGCAIGNFNHIAAVRKVVLGKYVMTADKVYISDNQHVFDNIEIPIMHQGVRFTSEVEIGDGSWIGENVSILGAKIGKNCVIGANSVVVEDIPDYSVAMGVPAKVIRRLGRNKL